MDIACPNTEIELQKSDAPQHVKDTYTLAFQDEFTGSSLDPNKWVTHFPWGSNVIINNEEQYYADTLASGGDPNTPVDPFSFDGDNLIITAQEDPNNPLGQQYTSGVITTHETFQYTQAYIEFCAKTPCDSIGSWSAGWGHHATFPNDGSGAWRPEDDIMEQPDNGGSLTTQCTQNNYHWYTGTAGQPNHVLWSIGPNGVKGVNQFDGSIQSGQYFDCAGNAAFSIPEVCLPDGDDFCNGFHTYGSDYCPLDGRIDHYVDGVRNSCITGVPFANEPMYFILNLAVGGNFPGDADPATFPAQFAIDYVRIYLKE